MLLIFCILVLIFIILLLISSAETVYSKVFFFPKDDGGLGMSYAKLKKIAFCNIYYVDYYYSDKSEHPKNHFMYQQFISEINSIRW